MPTVFERLQLHCGERNLPPLSHSEKASFGVKVNKQYRLFQSQNNLIDKPQTVRSVEPDGTFAVFDYPPEFTAQIDLLILEEYKSKVTKKRSRIKALPVKEASVKPSGQISGLS